jgi:hypothetical protein
MESPASYGAEIDGFSATIRNARCCMANFGFCAANFDLQPVS